MSGTETAMALLIDSFDKYAGKEGAKDTLTKGELKELLKNELGWLTGKASDTAVVDRIFSDLDTNKDNVVSFEEFGNMVCKLTAACHERFCKR